jgi:hypothetical protein
MALQPGTTNLPSLNLQDNLTVGGTSGYTGAASFAGTVTFQNAIVNQAGAFQAGTIYTAAGTTTLKSGFVGINLAGTGFAVQVPAPAAGAEFRIVCMATPTSGNHTVVLPPGGTIYQGTVSGTVLTFNKVGQTAILLGMNATQYFSLQPGTMNPTVS